MDRLSLRSVLLFLLLGCWISWPALAEEDPPKLLGESTVAQLKQAPFDAWYQSGYDEYKADGGILEGLRQADLDDVQVQVFYGTWCGDSRREVPRLLKVLDTLGHPQSARTLIAVDREEALHKRSPDGEEEGLGIYRVPTVIVSRHDQELGRLVEHPVESLERDLLAILQADGYTPSYASYPVVRQWIDRGLLGDVNTSADGLANQVRSLVSSEWELYSAGRVLWSRGDVQEAAKLLEINCSLFWESATCHARLAEAQIRAGQLEAARKSTVRALRRNDDPEAVDTLVELVERTIVAEKESGDDGAH